MTSFSLNANQINTFHEDGYLVVKGLFSEEETDKLYRTAVENSVMQKNAMDLNDQSGKKTRLSLWFTPGDDSFGYLTRSEKMIGAI